ncbi:MAG: hypothetical protein EON89_13295 [Brevundimonas sp.]|nr:MAG: hypothetical protein EON89_13295 [Brevundimonas sp.]
MKDNKDAAFLPIGIAMGLSMGVALGVATDNLALGLSLGVALGCGVGVALMGAARAKRQKDEGDKDDGES